MARRRRARQESRAASAERCGNHADDAAWDRRQRHRLAGLAAVKRSRDFTALLSMVASGELSPADMPMVPDADDRTSSKRQWHGKKIMLSA